MAEHLSVNEIEKEAKKLKRDLESWREVILPLNSVLLWEENAYLGILIGTTTLVFLLLWQLNPSILSMLSFFGIIVTVIDYLVPTLTLHFCHPEKWTSTKERKLEAICTSLASNKIKLTSFIKSFYQMRKESPKRYYAIVIMTLFCLSWIGNSINNLFLTYLAVTSILLLPGIQQRGLIDQYKGCIYSMVKNKIGCPENVKSE
ncbi:hypothetical protein RUM44_007934 [Polyplax serrata]|uniref:RETREG1-3/ARL6IP-like N-terminal reticulon-homology domain-containing protein n=1 Tax=Polyplax serrata TaxID=468196 RepID=A0ABR1B7H6_POLSC